jgi:hypothetical protein
MKMFLEGFQELDHAELINVNGGYATIWADTTNNTAVQNNGYSNAGSSSKGSLISNNGYLNVASSWFDKNSGEKLTNNETILQIIIGSAEMIAGFVGGVAAAEVSGGSSVFVGINVMADGANLVSAGIQHTKANPGDMYVNLASPITGEENGIPIVSPLP